MLLLASASFAQSFDVKIGEKVISNGEKVEINLQEMPIHWIIPNVIGVYTIDPEIKIVADAAQTITIEASDDIKDGILQNCAFGNCTPVTESACPATATKAIEAQTLDAAIHLTYGSVNPVNLQRAFDVKISNGTKTVAFTVQYNIGTYAASVTDIMTGAANAPYYTLGGVKTNTIPTGKVYIKGGKKYIKK